MSEPENVATGRVAAPAQSAVPARKPPAGVSETAKPSRKAQAAEAVLAALEGTIPPVRATLTYRLGILLAAAFMVLLPLVYLALIAAVAFGVYYHAVHDVGMLQYGRGRGKIGVLLVYLAPIVIGGLLVLFMFKPLLSRPAVREQRRSVRRSEQPLLFAFVERICEAVRAPVPARIDLDCQVNASASFRRGMLSFLGGDLVLTIGLPLVAGMTLRQFAGVLAHEFGHFAQGSGMRLTYVVRSINLWFARVVYERDQWDERLVRWSHSIDIRVGWIFFLTRAFVWLTRKILWVLMTAGHFVAGYMLRQMEFDADRYEARLAGSDTFAKTCRRLTELNLGYQGAMSDLRDHYREGRLADDVPALIVVNADQIPPPLQAKIDEHLRTAKAGWFSTHPGDSERVASARREQAAGIVRTDAPASAVFDDFPKQCRLVTLDLYRGFFGDEFDKSLIQPTESLVKRTEAEQGHYKALARYFQGGFQVLRPLPMDRWRVWTPANPKEAAEDLKAAREEMLGLAPEYREAFKKYDEADTRSIQAAQAEAFHAASLRVKPDMFTIDLSTADKARKATDAWAARRRAADSDLRPFEAAAARRLRNALDLLAVPKVAARFPDGEATKAEAERLLATAELLSRTFPAAVELRNDRAALGGLLSTLDGKAVPEPVVRTIRNRMARVAQSLSEIHSGLAAADYPFDHAKGKISLAAFVYENPPDPENPGQLYEAADLMCGTIYRVYARAVGRLCEIAEEVERLLGLPPLPEPAEENAPADGTGSPSAAE